MRFSVRVSPTSTTYKAYRKSVIGAFIAGLVVPREGGLAIALTEKLEDMVSIIFLPLVGTASIHHEHY